MKITAILFAQFLLSSIAFSSVEALYTLADDMDGVYRATGNDYARDNNFLDAEVMDKAAFKKLVEGRTVSEVSSYSQQKNALSECVFYTKGAYTNPNRPETNHISVATSMRLAGKFTSITRRDDSLVKLVRIEGKGLLDLFIHFTAPCAVAFYDVEGNILVIQGNGTD
ncbi:hypothetical protein [Pseudobacteriovorax antillogorgiicola]|uniref:Uncharacterized protein n=1 Tax=Pseudobacteriovorax antillogorgiicola TaxID=1513793 RepID=A0A1Y6BWA0_9BACT|nr:hypothetical protein [Pseudobacteriovorax antillogorgiicola]TCS50206.1 hypothetical protein EDD56_11324 [Pseudobacteriovorax antillogorgiicola]SMF32308.1 hypothetical protein SAMN06296036_11023 [Pseudobacteriovorax antillogorgiicola]